MYIYAQLNLLMQLHGHGCILDVEINSYVSHYNSAEMEDGYSFEGLLNHPSYHGNITGTEAELKLEENDSNSYITRYSKFKKLFKLTVMKKYGGKNIIIHFTLDVRLDRQGNYVYQIEGTDQVFTDPFKMLKHYQIHPINSIVDSIGECLEPGVITTSPRKAANYRYTNLVKYDTLFL